MRSLLTPFPNILSKERRSLYSHYHAIFSTDRMRKQDFIHNYDLQTIHCVRDFNNCLRRSLYLYYHAIFFF